MSRFIVHIVADRRYPDSHLEQEQGKRNRGGDVTECIEARCFLLK